MLRRLPKSTRPDTLVPSTTLFRSDAQRFGGLPMAGRDDDLGAFARGEVWSQVKRLAGLAIGGELERQGTARRSEEHTSELQSLMRISYAVFCLTKKNYMSLFMIQVVYLCIMKIRWTKVNHQ